MRARRTTERGFTIVELLTVIAVIGILVAAAAPSFIHLLRDRRVDDAARTIADIYRTARARALGRGAAIVVQFDDSAAGGNHFQILEAVTGPADPLSPVLPVSSCSSANFRVVTAFDERSARYAPAAARFKDPFGATLSSAAVCFSPRGTAFIGAAVGGPMARMNGVPRVDVTNTFDGKARAVIIPPTGGARVVSRVVP
ncbi:MAG: prepilin-type N-terminal cleavage/methylation domain-containing protein [Myxococcales bacterium]|nr:prepilin-type N-terminal cleavage/methylation domain-containing protein [Myxococcales bacterium]